DPRPICDSGDACTRLSDVVHAARFCHGGATGSIVDEALLMLAKHPQPDTRTKPPCRYGLSCHIRTAEHLARFSHPEKGAVKADSARGGKTEVSSKTDASRGTTGSTGRPLDVSSGGSGLGGAGGPLAPKAPVVRPWSASADPTPSTPAPPAVPRVAKDEGRDPNPV
ncbi:unnamed protein product, partial [Effrenium voratum]